MEKLLLTAAANGNLWTRKDTPYIPLTAEEITAHGLLAIEAGASVLHIHARDEQGGQTRDPRHFEPLLETYRAKAPEVVLEMSVGAMEGEADKYLEPLLALRPDCASFNLKSDPAETALMFELFDKYQIKPVFEVFDAGMADKLKGYIAQGLVKGPVVVNVVFDLTSAGKTFREYDRKLLELLDLFPEDWLWSVTRGAEQALALSALAISLGGHVRTGLEDSIYMAPGVYAKDSAELIARAAGLAKIFGREVAAPAEARRAYGLN